MQIATENRWFFAYYTGEDLKESLRKAICDLVGYIGGNTTSSQYDYNRFIIGEGPSSRGPSSRYIRILVGEGNSHLVEIVDSPAELSRLESDMMKIYKDLGFAIMDKDMPIQLSVNIHARSPNSDNS